MHCCMKDMLVFYMKALYHVYNKSLMNQLYFSRPHIIAHMKIDMPMYNQENIHVSKSWLYTNRDWKFSSTLCT